LKQLSPNQQSLNGTLSSGGPFQEKTLGCASSSEEAIVIRLKCQQDLRPSNCLKKEVSMRFKEFSFGSIRIDGVTHEHDVVIDRGDIRKRKKKASKEFRDAFGHTPLSVGEEIPWKGHRLVIGTGAYGGLPVMDEVKREAARREIELLILPTAEAVEALRQDSDNTNAILHVTC
jgi:hypothetical protein